MNIDWLVVDRWERVGYHRIQVIFESSRGLNVLSHYVVKFGWQPLMAKKFYFWSSRWMKMTMS
ncbi:MAG: hypothetical protein N3B16_12585 [Candidatus Aminicenantes bacterium]|nr:hypothetical protein [Candidatus Aminicenantes bacterium]